MNENCYFFWGGFCSNWHPAKMQYKNHWFSNSEQAYMWEKAMFFKDYESAGKILQTTTPDEAKALGRQVKKFDSKAWYDVSYQIMLNVVLEKFKQNNHLLFQLVQTEEVELVEASPFDVIWGIGLGEKDAEKTPPSEWPGENRLGKVLMEVRDKLQNEQ